MATLDPRLLELIGTLVAARMDWLVFEIMDRIKTGERLPETADALVEARRFVRSRERLHMDPLPQAQDERAEPIEGDGQIAWAAAYVGDRLEALVAMTAATLDALEEVGSTSDMASSTEGQPAADDRISGPLSVTLDEEPRLKVDREGIKAAPDALVELRKGLVAWADRANGTVRA